MPQGILPFKYETEQSTTGLTSFAGLPLYVEMMVVSGLTKAIQTHLRLTGQQGWTDLQMMISLILLNLAGGDCVDDLDHLEQDSGLTRLMNWFERTLLPRRQRSKSRWRRERTRTFPSPAAARAWLEQFHDPVLMEVQSRGTAIIPWPSKALQCLSKVNLDLIKFLQKQRHQTVATLDMDATLIEVHKRNALFSYKGFKAYQPLNCWWAEQQIMLHSEFRDGNVPAGFDHVRYARECVAQAREAGAKTIRMRGDTAAYQKDLILLFCGEGTGRKIGYIEYSISVDISQEFRNAVLQVEDQDWKPVTKMFDHKPYETGQEWAEVGFVPNWIGHVDRRQNYRYIAIRELLPQLEMEGVEPAELPFPVQEFPSKARYKISGIITNRTLPGNDLIAWHRERCGKSEEVHAVLKNDLAGGHLPSNKFGSNAAWWMISILANNLNTVFKTLALGKQWANKRLKALRFHLISVAGRVIQHARQLMIRISNGATMELVLDVRKAILVLAEAPDG